MVAQLRGKVTEEALLADEGFDKPEPVKVAGPSDIARDAIDALITLGYTRADAERLVAQVEAESEPATVEEIIRGVFSKLTPALGVAGVLGFLTSAPLSRLHTETCAPCGAHF